jgi:hypothetical protein
LLEIEERPQIDIQPRLDADALILRLGEYQDSPTPLDDEGLDPVSTLNYH